MPLTVQRRSKLGAVIIDIIINICDSHAMECQNVCSEKDFFSDRFKFDFILAIWHMELSKIHVVMYLYMGSKNTCMLTQRYQTRITPVIGWFQIYCWFQVVYYLIFNHLMNCFVQSDAHEQTRLGITYWNQLVTVIMTYRDPRKKTAWK